jgi:hypothetical protein
MHDGVETLEVCPFQITKIRMDFRDRRTGRSKVAANKQVSVEPHDLVSSRK